MQIIPNFIYRRISHRPNLIKIVDNIGWLFFDKILRMGVGLLVGVWIARYLGPDQFGLLNFALAFTGLFGAIAVLGLNEIVVRDIVRNPDGARLTLGTAILLQLIGGLIAFVAILAAIAYVRPDDALARVIVAILGSMMLLKASEVANYWFESQVKSKYTVWVQNGAFLLFATVKVLMILQQAPLTAFVWAMLGEAALVSVCLLVVLNRTGPTLSSLHVNTARAGTLLRDSWPLILSALAVTVYMKIDQIMLGQMIGNEAVGIYSAAVRISEIWYFIPVVVANSVFPAIIEAQKRSDAQYYARFQKLYDLLVIMSVAVALPMTFFSGPLITVIYGEEYSAAGPVLAVHIWGSLFVFLGVASSKWFIAENRMMLSLQRTVLGAIVNVSLNFWLIPQYGAIGAAFATLASQSVAAWLFDCIQPETRRMFAMKLSAMNLSRIFRKHLSRDEPK